MIPIITKFVKKYAIKSLTVIADSAMLSDANIESLEKESIHYIVGARLGYLSLSRVQDIVKHIKTLIMLLCVFHTKIVHSFVIFHQRDMQKTNMKQKNMYKKHMISLKKDGSKTT